VKLLFGKGERTGNNLFGARCEGSLRIRISKQHNGRGKRGTPFARDKTKGDVADLILINQRRQKTQTAT